MPIILFSGTSSPIKQVVASDDLNLWQDLYTDDAHIDIEITVQDDLNNLNDNYDDSSHQLSFLSLDLSDSFGIWSDIGFAHDSFFSDLGGLELRETQLVRVVEHFSNAVRETQQVRVFEYKIVPVVDLYAAII